MYTWNLKAVTFKIPEIWRFIQKWWNQLDWEYIYFFWDLSRLFQPVLLHKLSIPLFEYAQCSKDLKRRRDEERERDSEQARQFSSEEGREMLSSVDWTVSYSMIVYSVFLLLCIGISEGFPRMIGGFFMQLRLAKLTKMAGWHSRGITRAGWRCGYSN